MDPDVHFLRIEFLEKSKRLSTLGEGTFGDVGLYQTPFGELVIKETKIKSKSLGYPPDLLVEIDSLLKFRASNHIVQLKGICLDPNHRKGYLMLEKLDTNLSSWSRRNSFTVRVAYLDRLIRQIGSTLSLMHKFQMVHNDLKPNNILIQQNSNGPLFKLADFGKSFRVTNDGSPYGALKKYCPPEHTNIFSAEYWGFLMCCLEFLVSPDEFVRERDLHQFQNKYIHRGKFEVASYLKNNLSTEQYRSIPESFWKFAEPICQDLDAEISTGLEAINCPLEKSLVDTIQKKVLQPVPLHPKFEEQFGDFRKMLNTVDSGRHFKRFSQLLNIFLHRIDQEYSKIKIDPVTLKCYADVVRVIIAKNRARSYLYFDTQAEFLKFERAFLEVLGFQIWVV